MRAICQLPRLLGLALCLLVLGPERVAVGVVNAQGIKPANELIEQQNPYRQYSSNQQSYLDLFPERAGNSARGVAHGVFKEKQLWSVDWYAASVDLGNDGTSLVRFGDMFDGTAVDLNKALAVAFYQNGEEVKRYTVAELFKGKLVGAADAPFLSWLAKVDGFDKKGSAYQITLVDGKVCKFDVKNGKILSKSDAKQAEPGIVPVSSGYLNSAKAAQLGGKFRDFGLDVYLKLAKAKADGNLVLSPLDLSGALALAAVGGKGETGMEIRKVLHVTEKDADDLLPQLMNLYEVLGVRSAADVLPKLKVSPAPKQGVVIDTVHAPANWNSLFKPKQVILEIGGQKIRSQGELDATLAKATESTQIVLLETETAQKPVTVTWELPSPLLYSSITFWGDKKLAVNKKYQEMLVKFDRAQLEKFNFKDTDATVQAINESIRERTKGRLEKLLQSDDFEQDSGLVLSNSTFLAAHWIEPFKDIGAKPFHITPKKTVDAPMVYRAGKFHAVRTPLGDLLELPYKGLRLSMVYFLPADDSNLIELEQKLTGEKLALYLQALDQSKRGEVKVTFPKFTIQNDRLVLNDVLKELGMGMAFTPNKADFSALSDAKALHLAKVVHGAHIRVDEKGTVATASTEIILAPSSIVVNKFVADRPFLFCIRDRVTNCVLFMGRVTDPTKT